MHPYQRSLGSVSCHSACFPLVFRQPMKFGVQRTGAPVRLSDEHFYLSILAAMTGIVVGLVAALALLLHRNFLTIACDTAVLQSAIVNTLHGHWFANNGAGGPSILGSHTTFLLLAVIPFYVLAPFPETLFLVQIAGVYSTAIPLFLLARQMGQKPLVAFVVAGSGLASPLLLNMAFAPFHLESWIAAAAPLVLLLLPTEKSRRLSRQHCRGGLLRRAGRAHFHRSRRLAALG